MFQLKKQGAVDIFSGDESLNEESIQSATETIESCLNQGQPQIVFNLEKIPLIDSKGLEFLLDTQESCIKKGGAFKLASPNTLCQDILKLTKVSDHFELYDNAILAAGSFIQ